MNRCLSDNFGIITCARCLCLECLLEDGMMELMDGTRRTFIDSETGDRHTENLKSLGYWCLDASIASHQWKPDLTRHLKINVWIAGAAVSV